MSNFDIVVSIAAASLLLFLLGVFIVAFAALFLRKRQQFKIEQQSLQARFEETLLKSQLEIREQTLQHIGYELHDNIGQIASLIKINLATLRFEDKDRAMRTIDDTKDLIRQLISDVKSLSMSLNSDRVLHLGLISSIETEVTRLNKTGKFSAVLEGDDAAPNLPPNKTIILFRMVQEILNNVLKHSEAKRVVVKFTVQENLFTLVIADDGVGFDFADKLKSGGGSGLINLQNRAKLINGTLEFKSVPSSGTTITIQILVDA